MFAVGLGRVCELMGWAGLVVENGPTTMSDSDMSSRCCCYGNHTAGSKPI